MRMHGFRARLFEAPRTDGRSVCGTAGAIPSQKHLIDRLRSDRLNPMPNAPTILVFDSGLGGLTVLREIVRRGPTRITSMSPTTCSSPMAITARRQIIARVVPMIGELIAAHAPDLVVIACNTMSTLGDGRRPRRLSCAVRRHRAGDQAGLRAVDDQARLGARHQGHRQARIYPGPDPRSSRGIAR